MEIMETTNGFKEYARLEVEKWKLNKQQIDLLRNQGFGIHSEENDIYGLHLVTIDGQKLIIKVSGGDPNRMGEKCERKFKYTDRMLFISVIKVKEHSDA